MYTHLFYTNLPSMFATVELDRIERRLDALWDIGKTTDGGVTRTAYSPEEDEAIEYILDELPNEYAVETDAIGNVFATREPHVAQSVFVGSHLDSVFNGGRLDGTLGVVVALEAMEAVDAADDDPTYPPTLTIFRAEESARFGQHTIGSRGMLGMLTVDDLSTKDQNGVPIWQAMQQSGFRPTDLSEPTIEKDRIEGFLEVHIEQGRVLDAVNDHIGIVTSIRAPVRYRVTVVGNSDHSGATPMDLRQDALTGAAKMVAAVEEVGSRAANDDDLVATVGDITAVDGAINKVCGEVVFPIDIRSTNVAFRNRIESRILDRLREIADERDLTITMDELDRSKPVNLDKQVNNVLAEGAETYEIPYRRLPSGGGHDAMNFQLSGIPTGLVFTPSIDGISHNPQEKTDPNAVMDATKLIAFSLLNY